MITLILLGVPQLGSVESRAYLCVS